MEYLYITDATDPYLPFIHDLYHSAFPVAERRIWKDLLAMLDASGNMHMLLVLDGDREIGFVVFWIFENGCFIEHLAVDPQNRGKRYGERIMQELMPMGALLLEVELPGSPDALRRIGFYERLGFQILPFDYRQPSYHEKGISYPMLLMSNSGIQEEAPYAELLQQIRERVYFS